jgi:hypothetical protein
MAWHELHERGCRLRPAGASRGHDTHRLHAWAPRLVGQTVERVRDMQRMQSPQPSPAKGRPVSWGYACERLPSRLGPDRRPGTASDALPFADKDYWTG